MMAICRKFYVGKLDHNLQSFLHVTVIKLYTCQHTVRNGCTVDFKTLFSVSVCATSSCRNENFICLSSNSFHLNSHTLTKLPKQVYKLEPLCTVQYPVWYEELLNSYHLNVHALNIKLQAYKLKHILRHKSGHHYLGNNDFFLQNLQCYYFTGLFHTR